MIKTFRYRIKDSNVRQKLARMASDVNFVWNYCNATSMEYLDKKGVWLSAYNLHKLTSGCSVEMNITAATINLVCCKYVDSRRAAKRRKLSWRSYKRSLGWIPFRAQCISVCNGYAVYRRQRFKIWHSRPLGGIIQCGSFSQDAQGRWYISVTCEVPDFTGQAKGDTVGLDLGLKTIATLSDGTQVRRENPTAKHANGLAAAQRARKKRRSVAIHAKIRNIRKDWNHKQTTALVKQYSQIFVGDVSPSKLMRTRLAKSVSDAGWGDFKTMLKYKAIALGVDYQEVKEKFSTVTCSTCLQRTGPSGLRALGVREWTCSCGATHNRDVNAARNILRFGRESLIKGAPLGEASKQGQT